MRVIKLIKTADGARWSVAPARALRDRGHEVVFALPSQSGALPDLVRAAGLDVVVAEAPLMGSSPIRQPAALRRLRHQLQTLSPDVVVSHLYASALAGRLALSRTEIPHVYVSAGPLYLENPVIHLVERALWRLDAHIVCSSGHLFERYLRLGVPASRLSVVPYGVPATWGREDGSPSRASIREALGLAASAFVVICAAYFYAPKRLVHRGQGIKGHDVLLAAWHRYKSGGGPGTLVLVGSGFGPGGDDYRNELMARWARLPSVQWVDTVGDIRPYYRAADISVSPSLSENLGAPAEASKLSVPSIASRVGGLPEIVVDRWNGWLVPAGDPDALARALHEAAAAGDVGRKRFGERARQRADELFDEQRNGGAFADLIERVVAGAPSGRC